MEKLFLEEPTIDRKEEALSYLEEHIKYHSAFHGTGGMEECLRDISYQEWLLELKEKERIEVASQIDRCPSKTFFVIREWDNKIVGMVQIRYHISKEKLNTWASHIGYGIRPMERRKGYAKIALFLALLEEQKKEEENVLLICDTDNIASNRTILSLGGKLEKTVPYPIDGVMTNYYWISVNDAIRKYKGIEKE